VKDYLYISIYRSLKGLRLAHVILILSFLGFLGYFNAIFHPFIHDDVVFILKNPQINNLSLKSVFSYSVDNQANPLINQYFRPILELLYRLQFKVFGTQPFLYHFFNIIVHLANSLLLYLLLQKIFLENRIANLAIALIFLVHPIQSEAVATISGISNLVFTLFFLLSFLFFVNSGKLSGLKRITRYFISLIFFVLALLSKEQAIVMPFVFLLYLLVNKKEKQKVRYKLFGLAGYFLVAFIYFLARKILFGFSLSGIFLFKEELFLRLLSIPRTLLTFMRLVILPYDLHYYRSTDILKPYFWPMIILLGIIAIMIFAVKAASRPTRPKLLFGLGWFVVTILPVLNIVPLINEYSFVLTAEHFMYLPVIGLLIFIAFLIQEALFAVDRNKAIKYSILTIVIISLLSIVITVENNSYWQDETFLFQKTLKYEKNFGRVRILLAKAYYRKKMYGEAITEYQKSLAIFNEYLEKAKGTKAEKFYLDFIVEIFSDMGTCYRETGDYEKAIGFYTQAILINPKNAATHNNIAVCYIEKDEFLKAAQHFKAAIDLNANPESGIARKNLTILLQMNKGILDVIN